MEIQDRTSQQSDGGESNTGKLFQPLAPQQFVDIIEHMNDGVVVLDKNWYYVYVNQKAAVMLQRQHPSDLIGKHIWTEYPEGIGQPFQLAYEKAMKEQVAIVFEDHYEPWDLWFENRIYPLPDSLLILFTDVTERKQIEKALRESEKRYQLISTVASDYMFSSQLDADGTLRLNWVAGAFEAITGYTMEEYTAHGGWRSTLHPDDLAVDGRDLEKLRANQPVISEVRTLAKDGRLTWVRVYAQPVLDTASRELVGIYGAVQDISERKRTDEALHEREKQLSSIYEAVGDVLFQLSVEADGVYRFTSANQAFFKTTGLSRDMLLGKRVDEIIPEPSLSLVLQKYKEAMESRKIIHWEEVSQYPTGELTGEVSIAPVFDDHGDCTHLVGAVHDITERKQTEKALRESEEKFSKVFHASPIPLTINRLSDGRYVEVNESFLRRTGYQRDEVIGKTALELGFWVHPEQREIMMRTLREKGSLRNFESQFRTRSGEIGTALLFREVVELAGEEHFIGTNLDVTERKQTEDALAASEAELRALFAAMDDVVLVIDREGVYRKIAPTNPNLLYKPPEELLGQTLRDVFPAEQAESFINTVRQVVATHQTAHIEYSLVINDRVVWFDASISRMDANTSLWMARDITDRKRAEEALRQLNEELEERITARTEELAAAMTRAQESDRLKSAFLAAMSHELRTPLNSIIGFTGVILQGLAGPLNEEQTKQLNMTRDSARHLLALINDVLDISKIEAGQLEILKRPFDMRQAIESALRVVHPLAQKKHLQLTTLIESGVGTLNNDRRRVEQVLINLINNAVKFTEQGEITIKCQIRDSWLETSVQDEGIGIQPEDIDKLFKPFRQIDTGPARSHEGTGLGLAICKRLVTAMGGEISVESQWGVGSTFKFTLPV